MSAQIIDPFLVDGPALISFSGGRTSGYMLWRILQAHGGALPADVHVTFANTGKEREETLRFVHDCATNWGARVRWLEWRAGKPKFEEVGYNSASRAGEPFAALIHQKQYLPNAFARYCTTELKVRVMRDFARGLGWTRWTNAIGLRHDEGLRVIKALARNDSNKEPFKVSMPLAKARVTLRDVTTFWADQQFDLQLMPHEGNCDLCFLKGEAKLAQIIRHNPGVADWWIGQEQGARRAKAKPGQQRSSFRKYGSSTYEDLARAVDAQAEFTFTEDDEHDVECGLTCAP